ncbi:MAG: HAD-IA family hydrolase, partial [Beijerinckiaceae bacterium]
MSRYRLVIFDFDGTLCDSAAWFRSVYNDVAQSFGLRQIGEAEFETLRGLGTREIMERLHAPRWKLPFIARRMRQLGARDADRIRLFEGAADALVRLRDVDVAIAIATSNAEANVRRILGPELAGLVDQFSCGAPVFGKASRLKSIRRRASLEARNILAVGDEVRDIEAARAAGF